MASEHVTFQIAPLVFVQSYFTFTFCNRQLAAFDRCRLFCPKLRNKEFYIVIEKATRVCAFSSLPLFVM